jgi:hypothetical protein
LSILKALDFVTTVRGDQLVAAQRALRKWKFGHDNEILVESPEDGMALAEHTR